MNRKNLLTTLCLIFAFFSVGFFAVFVVANNEPVQTVYPFEDGVLLDLTHKNFVEREALAREMAPAVAGGFLSGDPVFIGEEFTFTVSDDGLGIDYDETFVVTLDGTHGIILITKDAYDSFDGDYYHFDNPFGDGSTPWNRTEDLVTPAQLGYLLDQFDTNIYPTMADVYGEPNPRGDEGQKVWILILNIRDEAYYNPRATSYIVGYFSAGESTENNKNIMHIDTYDWENRVGPGVARPYLYEGAFAHEYEHLIHNDIDSDEPSWVDEGLADLAGYLCGYGHWDGHLFNYIAYHPMVSLTFWGGGLEDYGCAYIFALYLYEHFGGAAFISALVAEQANGIEGIENTLAAFGYRYSFDNVYDAWTIANYIDDPTKAGGMYGYELLDIGSADTRGATIEWVLNNVWWGPPDEITEEPLYYSSDWFYGIEPQPYTPHYFRFTNDKLAYMYFEGLATSGTPPYSGSYEWYSDALAWAHRSFYQTFTIPAGGATLNFYTYYEIEDDWDYGYVEVYDQNTDEWYTLDAPGTVDYVAHGQDNPNCPDGREPTDYETAGRWHAFTGASGDWIPVSMDLTLFAGHEIDLYFTLWQDGAFTLQNMWIDDISIPEIGFFDDVEAGEGDWISTGWYISDGIFENGWGVTLITVKDVATERYPELPGIGHLLWRQWMWVWNFPCHSTQIGFMFFGATKAEAGYLRVAIVSNHAGHILTSHYDFMIKEMKCYHRRR